MSGQSVAKGPWKRVVSLAVIALALALLYSLARTFTHFDYKTIIETVKGYSVSMALMSVVCTVLSYLCMGGYDWLGQRYLGKTQSLSRTLLVAFYSYAFSLNVGLSVISSSAIRYRMYQGWGYTAKEIAKLIVFASVSFWLGLAVLSGVALVFTNVSFDGAYPIPDSLVKPVGSLLVLGGFFYVGLCGVRHGNYRIRSRKIDLPTWKSAIGQIGVTFLDMAFAGAALYVLIPDDQLSFFAFISIFCIAFFGGLLSNAPGGIGVFETVILLFLPTRASGNEILAALVVYRTIYFLFPLLVACLLFAYFEGRSVAGKVGPSWAKAQGWVNWIAPRMLSVLIFIGGLTLLFAGSLPAQSAHSRWVKDLVPLSFVEASHFVASLLGLALLFLAYGIRRKIDSSYYLALSALALGAPLALFRGDGWPLAILLAIMFLILLPCRRYFYRRSSLLDMRMNLGSLLAILLAVASAIYLGFFVYHIGGYENQSWWQFEFDQEKPRFLRTSLGVALVGLLLALYKLVHTVRPIAGERLEACRKDVIRVIGYSDVASSNLALMGDKRFYFNEERDAFIMFRIAGRTWVSMGDPVGRPKAFRDLIYKFQEEAAEYGATPLFYQASKDHLYNYVDLGLKPVKVGEIARVRLADFSLEGSHRQSMRSRLKRVAKKGCTFEVLTSDQAHQEMERLSSISKEWLEAKNAKEKGFSLGYFDERYLECFRVAIVREDDRIVAFTNIWETNTRKELSIDLMRYSNDAPPSVMEFLFVELMLWAKGEGYQFFDLRVAPLSGIANGRLVPMTHKLLDLVFNYGESFYGFKGIRSYKDRFDPEWEPIYVAAPDSWRLPLATADLTRVVSSRPRQEAILLAN